MSGHIRRLKNWFLPKRADARTHRALPLQAVGLSYGLVLNH
jgi:hypothetical protein